MNSINIYKPPFVHMLVPTYFNCWIADESLYLNNSSKFDLLKFHHFIEDKALFKLIISGFFLLIEDIHSRETRAFIFGLFVFFKSGLDGVKGGKGAKGANGNANGGIRGERGDDGLDGRPGLPGSKGERGDDGLDGIPGPVGDSLSGESGVRGENGQDGGDGKYR